MLDVDRWKYQFNLVQNTHPIHVFEDKPPGNSSVDIACQKTKVLAVLRALAPYILVDETSNMGPPCFTVGSVVTPSQLETLLRGQELGICIGI